MTVFDDMTAFGVVPVITISDVRDALPLVDALLAGGLPVAEITFRTAAAPEAIEMISKHRPQMLVGAGTVLTEDQADVAKDAGAKFALSPGIDPVTLAHAATKNLPFAPGIMTPSDIQIALRAGCDLVKFFPAMTAGGLAALKSIAGPYLHTGMRFNPTGGISADTARTWLDYQPVAAVGGSWIATPKDIANQEWEKISLAAADAIKRCPK